MSAGIPVMIHLPAREFFALEKLAQRKGTTIRTLIEKQVARGIAAHLPKAAPMPGAKRAHVRLTPMQVRELATLTRAGWTIAQLAGRYGCTRQTISNWRRRIKEAGEPMNTIVIAPTVAEGKAEYPNAVAIVTPRSPHAARGLTAHRIVVLASMRDHPMRDQLVADARPSLVFRSSEVRFR